MPSCEKLNFGNCENVEVKVAAKTGSIYMMYREYKVKDGADYKVAPIIVSRLSMKHILLEFYNRTCILIFRKVVAQQIPITTFAMTIHAP